jgi:hypothetical protein
VDFPTFGRPTIATIGFAIHTLHVVKTQRAASLQQHPSLVRP